MNTRTTPSVDGWIDRINRVCGRFQACTLGEGFRGGIEAFRSSALNFSFVDARQANLYRTLSDVSGDDTGRYYAVLQVSGHADMQQDDRRARLAPGDITVVDSTRPSDFRFDRMSRQLSLIVPRDIMNDTLRHARVRYIHRIDGQSHIGSLAGQLIEGMVGSHNLDAEESEAYIASLLTLLQPELIDREPVTPHKRAFDKAVEVIEAHLCDPELTPAMVAGQAGVSLRSLYRTFSSRELTVAQYIRTRRLELCAQRLRQGLTDERLSALCFACGFSDTSHFSTAFKRHFGMSPTRYRAMAHH